MNDLVKVLLSIGVFCFALAGLVVIYTRFGLQKLPGDIVVQKGNFTFIFPIVSCLAVSIVINVLVRLWSKH